MRFNCAAAVGLAAIFTGLSATSAAEVSVQIQPKTFPTGRGGQLSVTVTGGKFDGTPSPRVPDDVILRPYGTSQNIQLINGQLSQSITQNFIVSAREPGDYTIPSFEVRVNGKILKTDPVSFTVTAGSPPPGLSNPSGGIQGQPQGGGTADATASESFLKLEFPPRARDHLYVGEMAPVRIKAYFPAQSRVSLQSAPRPEGEGFTLHNLSEEPEQSMEVVNGQQYRTVSWFAGISTVKAGQYPIHIALDATVMVPERSSSRRMRPPSFFGNSFFNDPFFDNFFDNAFTQLVPHEITLSSNGDPLDIRSLPSEGRPENFSGAVGDFTLGSYRLPADATAGEPRKIRVTIEGRGNFDRMSAPILEPGSEWKTYTPKTEFKPGDATSFSGSKTFEFSAVPQAGGKQEVKLAFSYFDPSEGIYKNLSSPAIPLKVDGTAAPSPSPSAVAQATAANGSATPTAGDPGQSETEKPPVDLAPPRLTLGTGLPVLTTRAARPLLWTLIAVCGLLIAAGFVVGNLRRRRSDPHRIAARRFEHAEGEALARAESAATNGDAVAFFDAARRALQTRIAAAWNRPAESLTVAELRHRLPSDSPAMSVFRQADAIAYAPQATLDQFDGEHWRSILHEALSEVSNRPSSSPPSPQLTLTS
ncbi:MAG: protein BatD [Verrucomicrobiae bacterium]|nr:protein BatD [Verrucomicrobiae bacterium]